MLETLESAAGGHLSKVTNPALDCSLALHIGFISARFRVKYDLILYCKGCLIKIGYFFMMSFLKITTHANNLINLDSEASIPLHQI